MKWYWWVLLILVWWFARGDYGVYAFDKVDFLIVIFGTLFYIDKLQDWEEKYKENQFIMNTIHGSLGRKPEKWRNWMIFEMGTSSEYQGIKGEAMCICVEDSVRFLDGNYVSFSKPFKINFAWLPKDLRLYLQSVYTELSDNFYLGVPIGTNIHHYSDEQVNDFLTALDNSKRIELLEGIAQGKYKSVEDYIEHCVNVAESKKGFFRRLNPFKNKDEDDGNQ